MGIKLERADIVIVASAHNLRIVSPQWLKEKKVNRERLQITAKFIPEKTPIY